MANHAKILLLLIAATSCGALKRQSLGGLWSVKGGRFNEIEIFNVTVPGGIFSDLMDQGIIEDIFYGTGDSDYRWVGTSDWTYSSTFTVDEELLSHRTVSLVFDGVDTFASISLNGKKVGTTENMFRRYVFDVKDLLQIGSNQIVVAFSSAVTVAESLAEEQDKSYAILPECPDLKYNGICHANMIRKMQASFSWDWGPAFASTGIWKNVYLEGVNNVVIDYVVATPLKNSEEDTWTLLIVTYLNARAIGEVSGSLTTVLNTDPEHKSVEPLVITERSGDLEIKVTRTMEFLTEELELWWPNGYGDQKLYNLTVTFSGEDEQEERTVRVGFRTVELVQEELGKGLSFYFKINGVPIFMKGANEIPINILPEKGQDRAAIQKVLKTAKDTHMNMLRVWGGGVYESDYFYDLADEYGIFLWQDFMFACAMYPTDDIFLENVAEEINHQLKRLGSHPSIALWAGNNENEAALVQNWYGTSRNYSLYKEDYLKLYVDVIETAVTKILPFGVYVTSSPSNGQETTDEGHVADNPSDTLYGDVHFYDYGSDTWSVSTFPTPRFASEYGYQSLPSWEAWLTTTENLEELQPDSAFMEYRQHHPGGQEQNWNLIEQQLKLPQPESDSIAKTFIYFSQVLHAQAIKAETEHYRSFKGRLDVQSQGNTMGALYWQLNDVWVAPTWSGMDFTGRWKMLQYFAQDFLNPVLITGTLTPDDLLELFVVFDGLEVPQNLTAKALLQIVKWESLKAPISVEFPVTLDPQKSVQVTTISAVTALYTAGCGSLYSVAKTKCFFYFRLLDQNNDDIAPPNYVFLDRLKNGDLADADVKIDSLNSVGDDGKVYEVVVSTDNIALFVWLDSHEIIGRFSENGWLQVVGTKTVRFETEEATSVDDLRKVLTVTHLRDPQNL